MLSTSVGCQTENHDVPFLRFGVHFQYDTLAVSIRNGAVTPKSTLMYRGNSSSILAVEDPQVGILIHEAERLKLLFAFVE